MNFDEEPVGKSRLARITNEMANLRAEVIVLRVVLASVIAEVSRAHAEPTVNLGELTARAMGFSEAAASGLRESGVGSPLSVTTAGQELALMAERFLCAQPMP